MKFTDFECLKQYLKHDSNRVSLNPVRFINVDSIEMWIEMKKYLLSLVDETVPLSKFCEGKDTTPNIKRLSAALKASSKAQLIVPLSEYLRIIPEQAESVIRKFIKADYQNNDDGKHRIYFLMYRMKSLLNAFRNDDPRASSCIILFETNEENNYKLTIVQKDLDVHLPGNEIDGFKSYLEYWEASPDKPLILQTKNAIHFEKNHFFDDVQVIISSYDLIKYQFGLPAEIYEELGSAENWNELARIISNEGSFNEACCVSLAINKYSKSLFARWNQLSQFQQWLLWIWTRLQPTRSYVEECARSCDTSLDFVSTLYCKIIGNLSSDEFFKQYKERSSILNAMKSLPPERFWEEISRFNSIEALSYLTCHTDKERKMIFEFISSVKYENRNTILPTLCYVYPKLYYYLQNDDSINRINLPQELEMYLSEYKWLKATDTITREFIEKVKKFAKTKGSPVFTMQPRNYYINDHYDDQTSILFVDGMGIEYANYLSHLFSDLDDRQYAAAIEVGYCALPSITEINKDFMNNRNTVEPPVRDLDELKHANNTHPESLIKQLDILEQLRERVLGLLNSSIHKIIIASDHGTSRMAVKVRNTIYDNVLPKPDNAVIYKYGRFCEATQDEAKYPTAINYNERLIFADYTRFAQTGAPVDEIHGGASPEEWLVPIVTIEKYMCAKPANIVITPVNTKYKPDPATKQVKVTFKISGINSDTISVKVKGKTYKCVRENKSYAFKLSTDKGDAKLVVKVLDGRFLGQFDIYIEQGINKNIKFDI